MIFYLIPIFIGFILNTISSGYVRRKAESLLTNPYCPLPDLIHSNFPKINTLVPDYFLILCIGLLLFHYSTLLNIERNILCVGICTIIRSFSVFLTILPTCIPKPNPNIHPSIYERLFISTHDLMFSGHTLFFIAIGNLINNFYIQIIGPFLLIISRQHYTIDIIASSLVYFYVYTKLEYIM